MDPAGNCSGKYVLFEFPAGESEYFYIGLYLCGSYFFDDCSDEPAYNPAHPFPDTSDGSVCGRGASDQRGGDIQNEGNKQPFYPF